MYYCSVISIKDSVIMKASSLFFLVALSCVAICTSVSVPKKICSANGSCTRVCDFSCPEIWHPVCATNTKGETETFSNECEMRTWNCVHDTDFTHSFDGICPDPEENVLCPEVFLCPIIYVPVCGSNSEGEIQTFSNKCEMDRWNCNHDSNVLTDYSILSDGICPRFCNSDCIDIYLPVCGTNLVGGTQTFSNKCEMDRWNCDHDSDYLVLSNGTCK